MEAHDSATPQFSYSESRMRKKSELSYFLETFPLTTHTFALTLTARMIR